MCGRWPVRSPLPAGLLSVPFTPARGADKASYQLLEDVDVVLVQGSGQPPLSHPLWDLASVQVVVWVSAARTRGAGRKNAPEGWRTLTRVFFHARLGGVTDGRFVIGYAMRNDPEVKCSNGVELFPNFLNQIWKPTESGRTTAIPETDTPTENTTRGQLTWGSRLSTFVTGPTVFSKNRWTSRRLTDRELSDALDMPADKFKQAGPE